MVPVNLAALVLVICISSFEAAAQSLSYLSYKQKSVGLFVLSWFVYLVIVYLLWRAYHFRGVGYINVIWSGVTTALMLAIGFVFFGERISVVEWVGVVFIMLGIGMMTFHSLSAH